MQSQPNSPSNLKPSLQLQAIDKVRYRKHLNRVIAMTVIILAVTAMGVSTLLIAFIGGPDGSNLGLNIAGVVVGAGIVVLMLNLFKQHPYMHEVVYAWRLKQALNRIYRRSAKLNPAVENNNVAALTIMNFNLKGSKQLYELDDNTLTMVELNQKIKALEDQIQSLGLNISTDDYRPELLKEL